MSTLPEIEAIRAQLRDKGAAVPLFHGKRLFVVLAKNLGMDSAGMLIALEGSGTFFWEMDRPLNAHRLINAGYSMVVAGRLALYLNSVLFDPVGSTPEPLLLSHSQAEQGQ